MSAICGIVNFDGGTVAQADVLRMATAAAHRGPDGIHSYCRESVGVVALELNLRGDSSGESRPVDRDGLICVADARLDNLDEPAMSRMTSDPERILVTLATGREKAAASILGDFAIALFDRRNRSLRLLRDPMGMRSLYYRVETDRVFFATEISQIFAACTATRKLNNEAIAWYLCGMQVPPGCVFYEGIHEVLPGEEISFSYSGDPGRVRTRSRMFWEPDPSRRLRFRDDHEYIDAFRELLGDAMRSRLRTGSPAGVSLSGGIDSGTIASFGGRLAASAPDIATLRAYSWVFDSLPQCDESENIARIAGPYSIPVTRVRAEDSWPLIDYPSRHPHFDDPFTSMFQPVMDRVLTRARNDGVRQMFYGFRGDVMCGGNVNDLPGLIRRGRLREMVRELNELSRIFGEPLPKAVLHYILRPALSDLIPRRVAVPLRDRIHSVRFPVSHRVPPGSGDAQDVQGVLRGYSTGPYARAASHVKRSFLVQAGIPDRDPIRVQADRWQRSDARNRFIHIYSPLVTRGVAYTERLTAEFGIGFADPWSDRRVAEFILACPQHIVDRALEVKRLAKLAMVGIMPEAARAAADKVSPEPHYIETLRTHAHAKVLELITDSRCAAYGFIDEFKLATQFQRFAGDNAPPFDLWSTLSLEIWLRAHWD